MNRSRILIIILIILTLALGAGAIYLGYKSTQEEAPSDISVSSCGTCDDGTKNRCCADGGDLYGTCMTSEDWTAGYYACNSGGGTDGCTVSSISGDQTAFTLSGNCSGVRITKYSRSYSGTSHVFYPSCITNSSNGSQIANETASASTYTAYTPGACVQIDADEGGVSIGVCRCVPAEVRCGDGTINQNNEQCEVGIACSGSQAGYSCNTSTCLCSPPTPSQVRCGDGIINQSTEECEVGVACTGANASQVCNETTCLCEDPPALCQNGTLDPGEECDPTATPTGCTTGAICQPNCECRQTICGDECTTDTQCPTDHTCDPSTDRCVLTDCLNNDECTNNGCTLPGAPLPSTAIISDKADSVLGAVLAVLTGLIMIKFGFIERTVKFFRKLGNSLTTNTTFAHILAPVSQASREAVRTRKKQEFEDKIRK